MVLDVYVELWFNSGVHGNSIITIHLWKGRNICKGCGNEMNIKWYQVQRCSFCVLLTTTIVMDNCGDIFIPGVINKLRITNNDGNLPGIKEYPTDGN